MVASDCNPRTQKMGSQGLEVEDGDQKLIKKLNSFLLHKEFEASLGFMRLCLRKEGERSLNSLVNWGVYCAVLVWGRILKIEQLKTILNVGQVICTVMDIKSMGRL